MKVLMIHNRYKITGGEDVSTNVEAEMLKSGGIDIEKWIITNDSIENENKINLAINTIWSKKYHQLLLDKIKENKYDIIHVQNFFPLFSPSIFYAAKKAGTKIVMTIRNYRLICPNGLMYVHGKICRDCVGKTIPYPAIMKKCYRDDMGATTAIVGMLGVHNILNTWSNKVDGYICISAFVKQQLIKSGFDSGKLHVKYNFVTSPVAPEFTSEGYYIFVGRTSDQKGLPLLLKTFEENKKELMIVGDGPLNEMAESFARRNANITFAGELPLEETYRRIAKAKALIAPSQSDEPFGRTIAEAFAHGTPVIGSALGGISELIQDGVNGFLFDPYQATALQETITKFENFENAELMRRGAFDSYQKKFTSNMNYDSVMEIYNKVLTS